MGTIAISNNSYLTRYMSRQSAIPHKHSTYKLRHFTSIEYITGKNLKSLLEQWISYQKTLDIVEI